MTFTNSYYAYIENGKNEYAPVTSAASVNPMIYFTGYHRIPNQVWADYMNPRQWFEMIYGSRALCIKSASIMISNMIPLTEQAAIQGNATFTTFNNTIYALCYEDNSYETDWEESTDRPDRLWFREGLNMVTNTRYMLPTYTHSIVRTVANPDVVTCPHAFAWDPLINAESIKELRPGKNAVQYHWSASEDRWINTHLMQQFDPSHTPGTSNTETWFSKNIYYQNLANITPHMRVNFTAKMSDTNTKGPAGLKPAILTPSDPFTSYLKPIPNWFIKMVPLFDAGHNLIKTTAQVLITTKLTVETLPMTNAIQAPVVRGISDLGHSNGVAPISSFHYKTELSNNSGKLYGTAEPATYIPRITKDTAPQRPMSPPVRFERSTKM